MPVCKRCKKQFEGVYRAKYCSPKCRLMHKVGKDDNCWFWGGGKTSAGYGVLNIGGKGKGNVYVLAHRFSYEIFKGKINDGLFVLHTCDNPSCVNPEHLFLGTNADNMHDMALKGRAAWAKRKMPQEVRNRISETRKKLNWKPSEEQIEKSIAARREAFKDPEKREKFSAKMRGENNPFYGKMSEARRAKFAKYWESLKGRKVGKMPEERKNKIGAANFRAFLKKIGYLPSVSVSEVKTYQYID